MIEQILWQAGQAALVCFVVMLFLTVMYGSERDKVQEEETDIDSEEGPGEKMQPETVEDFIEWFEQNKEDGFTHVSFGIEGIGQEEIYTFSLDDKDGNVVKYSFKNIAEKEKFEDTIGFKIERNCLSKPPAIYMKLICLEEEDAPTF